MSDTTTTPQGTPPEHEPPEESQERRNRGPFGAMRGLMQGDLGSARVLLGIAAVWAIFQSQEDRFLSAVNLTNLTLQIAAVGTISVGVVLILLLGEIDLSVGAVSGLAAAVMAVLSVKNGWDPVLALVAGLAVGTAIGALNGFMVTTFQLPSFVVTLAGLIAWQGALLAVLGSTGTINLPQSPITDLTSTFFAEAVGWIVAVAGIAVYVGIGIWSRTRRKAADLAVEDLPLFVVRAILVAAGVLAAIWVLNQDRGLPLALVILVGVVMIFAFITTRTRFGRHIYAVGGNAEAARRAGIKVKRVKMAVFMLGSTMAAAGGILAASRLIAVNQSSGGSDLLLLAIAGPVVAGVSLFGGRGSVWAALLGALLIGSISNGMFLLNLPSSTRFMITGAVLLAAVTLDSATRLRRQRVRGTT